MSDGRIRVLHVVQNLNYGGLERLIAELFRGANSARFDMHVLALEYLGRFSKELPAAAGVHLAPRMSRWSLLWPRALVRTIRRVGPDVVHTHSGVWYKASLAARMAQVPVLLHTEHGRPYPERVHNRVIDGLAARRTDAVVAVSNALAERLARSLKIDPSRIRVLHNGVDTETFRPGRGDTVLRGVAGIPAGSPVLGSVGRLEPVKAYDVMIGAFAELRDRRRDPHPAHLVLVGDGSAREALERIVEARELGDAVHLVGWRDDIPDLLSGFTVFSLSSRSEGTSVSLLEAMAAGVCPVVTDVGGNSAVLGPGLRHRLVPPGDPGALASAWMTALDDPSRRRRDGRTARARVQDRYSLESMIARYQELYSETVGGAEWPSDVGEERGSSPIAGELGVDPGSTISGRNTS